MEKILKKIKQKIKSIFLSKREYLVLYFDKGSLVKSKNCLGFQTRSESTLKLILEAITTYNDSNLSKKIVVFIGDHPNLSTKKMDFCYCTDKEENLKKVIPDFIFGNWPQAGITNYDETVNRIILKGKEPYKKSKMLWIGNSKTHYSRVRFLEIAKNNSDLIDGFDTCVDKVVLDKTELPYISLEDHTDYKYLLDIEGNGYSARVGLLLFSQRVVFIQERKWKQYYLFDLEPYKHYIPVKNDLSDLVDKIKEVENKGEDFYNQITANALKFAQENLMYKNAVAKVQEVVFNN